MTARRPLAAALLALPLLAAACGGTDQAATTGDGASPTTAADGSGAAPSAPPATEPATTSTTVDPGTLPQTDQKPSATDPQFVANSELLWRAIVEDDPQIARPFFFPLAAYLQVKQISDPAKDYENRLLKYFDEDIHTLHRQLGANASKATFDRLVVNEPNATWIKPGVEYNKGAYWRVQYNKLQYDLGGSTQSFPVVSMISWRGQWYVVHLSSIR